MASQPSPKRKRASKEVSLALSKIQTALEHVSLLEGDLEGMEPTEYDPAIMTSIKEIRRILEAPERPVRRIHPS